MNELVNELLSYKTILENRNNFKKAGGKYSDDFNLLDIPGHKFFKILFYFWNEPADDLEEAGGLLAPTWTLGSANNNFWRFNSAWGYLKNNAEEERADKLEKFVGLLSNISTYSPWYFKTITGIDSALERKQITDNVFKLEDQRKQISIACMPDAFDDRIGTLLDLYRDIVWSWSMKREILPANLRKFDMGLYIFESPVKGIHDNYNDYAVLKQENNNYQTSYKYIEFHNCEIDYNSTKTAYNNVNNQEGMQPEYTINIFFDDCYEYRYNELMMRTIGDMVIRDSTQYLYSKDGISNPSVSNEAQGSLDSILNNTSYNDEHSAQLEARLNHIKSKSPLFDKEINREFQQNLINSPDLTNNNSKLPGYPDKNPTGFIANAIGQAVLPAADFISTKLKGALLGNLHGYSLSKFGSQLKDLANGNIRGAIDTGIDYANKAKTTHYERKDNIFHGFYSKHVNIQDMPNQVVVKDKQTINTLGNIYKGKSLANNL